MVPHPPAPRVQGLGQNLQEEGWLPAASNLGQDKSWDQIPLRKVDDHVPSLFVPWAQSQSRDVGRP